MQLSSTSSGDPEDKPPLVWDEGNQRWIIERRGYEHGHFQALTTNDIFVRFVTWLFLILILYGAGMTIVVIFGHYTLATRMLNGFSTMFAGVLGLGSGYVLGRKRDTNESK